MSRMSSNTQLFKLLTLALGLCTSLLTRAQDYPTVGLLHNTSEMHSMVYHCESPNNGQLSCEFTQTWVRPKATWADFAKTLDKERKAFASGKPFSSEDCTAVREVLQIMQGKKPAPKADALASLSAVTKKDGLDAMTAAVAYCDTRKEGSYLDMVRVNADKDRRTCLVSSISFRGAFVKAANGQNQATWVETAKPEGECGVVKASRFEPETRSVGNSKLTFWRFVARKVITNPSGDFLPGAKCSQFDERPYTYDWRSKEHQLTCDYVEFSPL